MSEHGWNDPPPLPYKTLHSSNGQKRSHLNKRPCYPADSVQLPAHHSPVLCPPPTGLTAIPPAVGSIARNADSIGIANTEAQVSGTGPTEAEVSGSNATGTVNCSQLVDSLECLIQDLVTSGALQRLTADEIRKRLGVFSTQWSDGNLSDAVQVEVTVLVQALAGHDYSKADSIQVSLMADHVSEVNQWLPGIKKLITVLQSQPAN